MTSSNDAWLPLFPLNTVLFPDGILPLKIFEARYIDMVRECMRGDLPFGVALIKSGMEVGAAAVPEQIGCLARIMDWDMPSPGILMLRTQGSERFRIIETRVLADNRLEARVEMIAADSAIPVSATHIDCARALKTVIDNISSKERAERGHHFQSPFGHPIQLENAGWVANRWSEILPIPLQARQKLLELNDVANRLSIIYQYLQQHKIIQ